MEQLTIDGNDDISVIFEVEVEVEVEVVFVMLLMDLEEKIVCFGCGRCQSEFSLWARRLSSTAA
jgi:hypothetical protein